MAEIAQNIEKLRDLPKVAAAGAWEGIHRGYEIALGSKILKKEIQGALETARDLPLDFLGGGLQSLGQLITAHPIDATMTAVHTVKEATKDMARLFIAPVPTGIAALSSVLGGASSAVQAPFKGGFRGIKAVKDGMVRLSAWLNAPVTPAANTSNYGNKNGVIGNLAKNLTSTDSGAASSGSSPAAAAA